MVVLVVVVLIVLVILILLVLGLILVILILAVLLLVSILVVHWIFLHNSLFADSRGISLPTLSGFILIFKQECGSQSGTYRCCDSAGCSF